MGNADKATKKYVSDPDVARDVIRLAAPDLQVRQLREMNPEEIAVLFDSPEQHQKDRLSAVARYRDLFEEAAVENFTDGETDFVLVGYENQTNADYGMPIRVLLENAIDYMWQAEQWRKKHERDARAEGKTATYPTSFGTGMLPGDKLRPVITIVIYWSTEKWMGPTTLQDLIKIPSGLDASLVDNNRLILLEPTRLTDAQVDSCESSLKQVLRFLRTAHDKDALRSLLAADEAFQRLDPEAVHVIETTTKLGLQLPKNYKKGDKINMCQGIADMLEEARQESEQKLAEERQKFAAERQKFVAERQESEQKFAVERQESEQKFAAERQKVAALQKEIESLRAQLAGREC